MGASGFQWNCSYCGMGHSGICPRVKSIEYYQDGTTKRVEFHEQQFVTVGRPDPTKPIVITRVLDGTVSLPTSD